MENGTNAQAQSETTTSNNININNAFKAKKRAQKIKKILKTVLWIVGIIFLLAFCSRQPQTLDTSNEFNYEEAQVDIGDIDVTVTGDGVIEANSIYTITPKVTGEILEDYVEVDSFVEKGDLLYVIDSKDINGTINQASIAVEQSNNSVNQANIARQQSTVALEQSKLNYDNLISQLDDLKIYATSTGYINNLKIAKGSYVTAMSPVCDIEEKNAFEVTLEFRTSNAKDITIGNRAQLFYLDHFDYVDAYVTKIADGTNLFSQGAQVTNVTLRVDTTGYSLANARVEGTIFLNSGLELKSVNEGFVAPVSADVVVANSSGVVKEKLVDNGTFVNQGDLIAVLENENLNNQIDSAKISIQNAEMGIQNAEVTIKNAQSSRKSAVNGLNNSKLQLDNYNITSPISGKVVYKNAKKGDVISTYQRANSNAMVTIADLSVLKFEMQIDELDITKIAVGQEVIVTVEALENKEFSGEVANINTIGVSAAGTTNYTIVVEVPGNDEIYSGMTVDAEIKVANKQDVLRVPLTAVRKGDVVYRKASNPEYQDTDKEVPKGYEKVKVEIGLNSNEYIEITSGLSKGDIILVDKAKSSGVFNMQNMVNMMREN